MTIKTFLVDFAIFHTYRVISRKIFKRCLPPGLVYVSRIIQISADSNRVISVWLFLYLQFQGNNWCLMLKRHFFKPNLNETSHVYVIRRVITGRLWNDRIALMKSCVNFKDFLYSHGKMDLLRFSIKSDLDRKFSRNLEDLSFIQTSRKSSMR